MSLLNSINFSVNIGILKEISLTFMFLECYCLKYAEFSFKITLDYMVIAVILLNIVQNWESPFILQHGAIFMNIRSITLFFINL